MKYKTTNQKKNILIHGANIVNVTNLQENCIDSKYKIILLEKNIYTLEQAKKHFNTNIFPWDAAKNDITSLQYMLIKRAKKIDGIIIYTSEPNEVTITDQINEKILNENIQTNIHTLFLIIKLLIPLLKKSKDPFITIYLHKNRKNIKTFLSISECINSTLTTLTKTLNHEYQNIKNIRTNLVSTENINLAYKKHIYPYKKTHNMKHDHNIIKTNFYLLDKNIKNKIVIL